MTPPLEGFDGIGHIDYLQYLRDHAKRSLVSMPFSRSSLELYGLFPVCKHDPGKEFGGRRYESYFKRDKAELDSLTAAAWNKPFIPGNKEYVSGDDNWQKKHPTLYYRILNVLVDVSRPDGYMHGYFLYNFFSLLLLSLSLPAVFWFGKRLDRVQTGSARALCLLFISQPMVYIVACRISNDALAYPLNALICLAWFKTILAIHDNPGGGPRYLPWAVLAGVATGVSLWVKTYSLLFLPVVALHGAWAFFATKKKQYVFGSIVFIAVAVAIALPLLQENVKVTGELDGNFVKTELLRQGIPLDYPQKFKEFYLQSPDGYIQMFKMLIVRLWVGNWSGLANIPIIYCLYFAIWIAAVAQLVKKIKSSSIPLHSPYTQFFIFSLLLQAILFAGLARLGLQTAVLGGRITAVAGYYSYAFYVTELYLFWFLFRDSPKLWPAIPLFLFLFADICGVATELIYYYGAGEIGPGNIVIPHHGFFTELLGNWHAAPWTIIPIGAWLVLYFIFFVAIVSLIRNKRFVNNA